MSNRTRSRASAPLWGALLAGAGAWSVHLVASHFIVEASCSQSAAVAVARLPEIGLPLLVVTLAAVLVALAGALFATRRRALEGEGAGFGRVAGLAPVLAALSLFFALVIVAESLPLLLLGCGAA